MDKRLIVELKFINGTSYQLWSLVDRVEEGFIAGVSDSKGNQVWSQKVFPKKRQAHAYIEEHTTIDAKDGELVVMFEGQSI